MIAGVALVCHLQEAGFVLHASLHTSLNYFISPQTAKLHRPVDTHENVVVLHSVKYQCTMLTKPATKPPNVINFMQYHTAMF